MDPKNLCTVTEWRIACPAESQQGQWWMYALGEELSHGDGAATKDGAARTPVCGAIAQPRGEHALGRLGGNRLALD